MQNSNKLEFNFRPEIEGLRTIAALLVAIYHIWLGKVSGGVDVFFVVSGYLITVSLLKRYQSSDQLNPALFWLNLGRRLFPLAYLVLFASIIMCIIWLPKIQWDQTVREVFASIFYFQNWQLAYNAVDYLAQNNEASPFQHYWALAIQGQFYLVWPFLMLGAAIWSRKHNQSIVAYLLPILFTVFIASLSYSIYITAVNQPWAYFNTFARIWEFAIGGIIALIGTRIKLGKRTSWILGWLGLAAIISCGVILPVSNLFPGYAALLPTLGAALVLITTANYSSGVKSVLEAKPFVKFGSISYGLYLWHWPILIFYYVITGNDNISFFHGISIIVVSILLSILSTKFIETPIRQISGRLPVWRKAIITLSIMLPVIIVGFLWSTMINSSTSKSALNDINYPGAMIFEMDEEELENINDKVSILPEAVQARRDLPKVYEDDCHQTQEDSTVIECKYGVLDDPDYTIALVGGSHSAHWLPALERIAEIENIQISSYTKSSCRFTNTSSESCKEWNHLLMEKLISDRPDLVFTTADVGNRESVPRGYVESWRMLEDEGIRVLAIRDNPWFDFDLAACVEENGIDSDACIIERDEVVQEESPWNKLEDKPQNVYYVDLLDYICDQEYCKPVYGNVLVYRDKHHITATYSETLAPMLHPELLNALHFEFKSDS